MKGSAIANLLTENEIKDYESLKFDFLDQDVMALFEDSKDEEFNDR